MSDFVFNQAALDRIVAGPVRREVERRARILADDAQANIAVVIENRSVRPDVLYQMQSDHSAVIGLRDEGRVARYLDQKAMLEFGTGKPGDWMRIALEFAFR